MDRLSQELLTERANKKTEGIASGLALLLFQWPTGLADGFGLKELPYSPRPCGRKYTPSGGSPVSACAELGRYSVFRRAPAPRCAP